MRNWHFCGTKNAGVKRATEIIRQENISPEEWEEAKIEASKRKVIKLEREEERFENARNGILKGYDDQIIADITGLSIEQIQELRNESI